MEEIKLWKIVNSTDSPTVDAVPNVAQTETERFLEDILIIFSRKV
jgi:hypothetical protein